MIDKAYGMTAALANIFLSVKNHWLSIHNYCSHVLQKYHAFYQVPESKILILIDNSTCNNQHQTYDMIIITEYLMHADNILEVLLDIKKLCHERTRLIINWRTIWLQPFYRILTYLGIIQNYKNWLTMHDVKHLLMLAGYESIIEERILIMPYYIPGISWFCNNIVIHIPLLSYAATRRGLIARLISEKKDYTVSIIIACRNERGTIEAAIRRLPLFGTSQEIIFVEGHSKDGTLDELYRVQQIYSNKNIKINIQKGTGKADAIRAGFDQAQGELLMILDADLTMPPEELPKFYQAFSEQKGEFINGSRLIYMMESRAMPFLNFIANHGFALGFSWLFGQRVKDTLCGTKVILKSDYEKIVKNRSFFGDFDPFGDFDLLFGAAKLGLKIVDMPICYKNRIYGTSQIRRFKAGIQLVRMFILGITKFKFKYQ